MKKKTLALIATLALALSMTACGGKTEETANTNEPAVESQETTQEVVQESQPESTEAPVETEAPAETDTPVVEEAPAESDALPIEISELIYPKGEPDSDETYWMHQPYFIVTNTSDTAYVFNFSRYNGVSYDDYFEPNESIIVPAIIMNPEDAETWNSETWSSIPDILARTGDDIFWEFLTDNTDSERNRVQDMITITNGDTYPLGEGNENGSLANYAIFYDAEGNVITAASGAITISEQTCAFYINAEFEWATADVYYSYTAPVNQ